MLRADEVKAVIVSIHPIMDVDAVHLNPLAVDDAHAVRES
jgi:hypothetical protein